MGDFLRTTTRALTIGGAALLTTVSTIAMAQSAEPAQGENASGQASGLEDIVVTARRRAESLQEVPVAVTAFSAAALDKQYAQDIRGLAGQVPNVVITNVPGFNAASIGIRGQSTGDIILTFEPAIGVIVDDFMLAHVQTQLLDLFDVDRMEVLRGPQGTLFGKNTIGGVVTVNTKRPTDKFEGEVRLGYSSFKTKSVKGMITIPIIPEKLALRVVGSYLNSGGFYWNTKGDGRRLNGVKDFTGRAKLLWTIDPTANIMFSYEKLRDRDDSPASVNESPADYLFPILGYPGIAETGDSPFNTGTTLCSGDRNSNICPGTLEGHRVDVDGYYVRAEKTAEGLGTFTLVGGYRKASSKLPSDYTGEVDGLYVATRDDIRKQYSVEGRYNSDFSDRFKLTMGAMYWGQKLHNWNTAFLGFLRFLGSPGSDTDPNISEVKYNVNSYAIFGEGEYKATDTLSVFLGGRYTKEKKSFFDHPQIPRSIATQPGGWPLYEDSTKFSKPTFRAGYRWEISPGVNQYFTWSQGYKSGGYNEQAMSATSALPFKEETADSFELGFKTETADHRLRANVAAFYVKYKDLQRDAVVPFTDLNGNPGQETKTTNAGAAEVYGLELELSAVPIDGLTLSASGGYQKAKYLEFTTDVDGNGTNDDASYLKLRNAPKVTLNGSATYDLPPTNIGNFSLNATINYQSQYESVTLNHPNTQGQARTLVNTAITWTDKSEAVTVSAYVHNLLDKVYRVSANSVAGLWNFTNYAPPRSFGVEVGLKF